MTVVVSCFLRVPSGCGPAAGDQRQGGQPEQSPEAGEGGCGTRRQSGAAAGEEEEEEEEEGPWCVEGSTGGWGWLSLSGALQYGVPVKYAFFILRVRALSLDWGDQMLKVLVMLVLRGNLKEQCVGFRGDLLAEMEYNIHDYVFISVQSPKSENVFLLV